MNKKRKKEIKSKDFLVAGLGILGILYMLNFGFGILEILPDNLPFVGNMDEAAALFLIYSSLDYFEINVKSLFTRN